MKPFPCKFCDKAFATNSDLKQHIGVHGEGQRFECEVCGRTFNNRDSIILHRKQHTNSRTHFCVVCNKGFFKASCLNRLVVFFDCTRQTTVENWTLFPGTYGAILASVPTTATPAGRASASRRLSKLTRPSALGFGMRKEGGRAKNLGSLFQLTDHDLYTQLMYGANFEIRYFSRYITYGSLP